jgi:hypothetical protein
MAQSQSWSTDVASTLVSREGISADLGKESKQSKPGSIDRYQRQVVAANEHGGDVQARAKKNNPPLRHIDQQSEIQIQDVEKSSSLQSKNSEVTWNNRVDPENPRNFKFWKKLLLIFVVSAMNFVVSLAISLCSGMLGDIATEYDIGETKASLTLTTFILGLALGTSFDSTSSHLLTILQAQSSSARHRNTMVESDL